MNEHKDYKLKSGNILRVIKHPNPESPDIWEDENVFLVYDHRQFTVKREGFEPRNIYDYLKIISINKDLAEGLYNEIYNKYYIFPVGAYIHSDIHLSLTNTKNYPDRRWNVSTTGYVLVNKFYVSDETNLLWKEEYYKGKSDEEIARVLVEGLVKTWNQYLSGDVYGFQVLKPFKTYTITEENFNILLKCLPDNKLVDVHNSITEIFNRVSIEKIEYEEIDSCWGFYGDNPKENGISGYINDEIIEENDN